MNKEFEIDVFENGTINSDMIQDYITADTEDDAIELAKEYLLAQGLEWEEIKNLDIGAYWVNEDEYINSIEKELKEELINKELDILKLENKMKNNGCYTSFDYSESEVKEILESGSVIYHFEDNDSVNIYIDFDTTIEVDTDNESIFATNIKILDLWIA